MTKRFIWLTAFILTLFVVFALGVHFGRMSFTTSCGSQAWVSWDHGGQFPVAAYATVNDEANEHLKSLLQDRGPGNKPEGAIQFGGNNLGGGLTGFMDDTRIYNRALSHEEIVALYHDGKKL
jgi:hypothetical protein